MMTEFEKRYMSDQLKKDLYSFSKDEGYDPWDTYTNISAKKNIRSGINLYSALAAADAEFAALLDKISAYADYPVDAYYSYDTEAAMLRGITEAVPACSDRLDRQIAAFTASAEKTMASASGADAKQQKNEELQYVGRRELLTDKKIVVSMFSLWIGELVAGLLPLPDAEEYDGEFIDTVSSFVSFGERDCPDGIVSLPIFPHEPLLEDVPTGPADHAALLLALGAAARLYPRRIKEMLRDSGDGTVTVRLWKKREDGYDPVYVRLDKVRVYEEAIVSGGGRCLWTELILRAFDACGIAAAEPDPAELVECCCGAKLPVDVFSAEDDQEGLFRRIMSCGKSGSPVFAEMNGTFYEIVGTYEAYDYPREKFLRMRGIKDIYYTVLGSGDSFRDLEIGELLAAEGRVCANRADGPDRHVSTVGFDIIGEDDVQHFTDSIVSEASSKSYNRCAQDIYTGLLAARSAGEDDSSEYIDLISASREVLGVVADAYGQNIRYVERVVSLIRKSSDVYRASVKGIDARTKQRLNVCDTIDALAEMMQGEAKYDPRREFVHRYAEKMAELFLAKLKRSGSPELLAFQTEMLMEDKVFLEVTKKLSCVVLCEASPRQLATSFENYRKLFPAG